MKWEDLIPIVAAPTLGVLSTALAYLAYRRGKQADENAAELASTAQVYAGYGGLLERIQNDNKELRQRLFDTEQRLALAEQRLAEAETRLAECLREVRRLEELGREKAL